MEGLDDFERAVIDKLLSGNHPTLVRLREQAERASVKSRELTGAGFWIDLELPLDVPPLVTFRSDFEVGDVIAIIDGLENDAGFQLFVRRGRLDFFEGYAFAGSWPKRIRRYELKCVREPRELQLPEIQA